MPPAASNVTTTASTTVYRPAPSGPTSIWLSASAALEFTLLSFAPFSTVSVEVAVAYLSSFAFVRILFTFTTASSSIVTELASSIPMSPGIVIVEFLMTDVPAVLKLNCGLVVPAQGAE